MRHVLYGGDVHAEEAVKKPDVKKLDAYRVKKPDGSYALVLTDEGPDALVAEQDGAAESKPKGKGK
jgi:hypothetical protein